MNTRRIISIGLGAAALAACGGTDTTAPLSPDGTLLGSGGATSQAFSLRVKCELRAGRRSRASVDGNNLSPANAMWSARITSGGKTVAASAHQGIGDEVEFDFDSNANDIALGATAIPASFIVVSASGPDVTAELLNSAGQVVASGGADCRTR